MTITNFTHPLIYLYRGPYNSNYLVALLAQLIVYPAAVGIWEHIYARADSANTPIPLL